MFKTLAKLYPLVPAAVGCSLAFSRSVDLKGITAPSPCARRGATPNPNSGRIADLGHLHARASWASQSRSPSSPSSASGGARAHRVRCLRARLDPLAESPATAIEFVSTFSVVPGARLVSTE